MNEYDKIMTKNLTERFVNHRNIGLALKAVTEFALRVANERAALSKELLDVGWWNELTETRRARQEPTLRKPGEEWGTRKINCLRPRLAHPADEFVARAGTPHRGVNLFLIICGN